MPIQPDNICYNKATIIERAISRMLQEYSFDPEFENFTHIDAMTLNVERACQATIDLAMHIVAREHLGIPQNSADGFRLLKQHNIISEKSLRAMIAMTGFRNVAIHEYQELDMSILKGIATTYWKDMVKFCEELGMKISPLKM